MNDLINHLFGKNKKLFLSIGLFFGSFGLGYVVWKTIKYYRSKKISHEPAKEFINENKELFKKGLDSHNKLDEVEDKDSSAEINQEKNKGQVEVKAEIEEKQENQAEIKSKQTEEKKEELYEDKVMNDLLKKITNIIVFTIMRELKYLEVNKDKILDKIQFKSEGKIILDNHLVIYGIEFGIQNTFFKDQINYDLFLKSHNHYFNNDLIYKDKWIFLNTLKLSILTSDTVKIEFPEEIKNNFLKIVSNIFYVNLYKTWKEFKKEYLQFDSHSVPKKIVDTLYQKHLKETRREVYEFFKIPKNNIFDSKNYVRLYPFSLPYKDPVKTIYFKISDDIDKLCENMNKKIIPEIFLTECEETHLFEIKDVFNFI